LLGVFVLIEYDLLSFVKVITEGALVLVVVLRSTVARNMDAKDVDVCLMCDVSRPVTVVWRQLTVAGNNRRVWGAMLTWESMQEKRMTMERHLGAEGMVRILCEVVQLKKMANVVEDVVEYVV
jgi:RNAse (barnase) inhibitor barstar